MNERCQLGLSSETLSAWRAKALPRGEQAEVGAHVTQCPVCQTTLASFERVAQLLRTPPAMPPQAAVWRGVQSSMTTMQRGNMTKSQKTLTLTGLTTAATLVILLAVVFVLINNHTGQTHPISVIGTPSPTATTLPSPTPTILTLKMPSGLEWTNVPALSFGKDITFGQNAPLTGYACGNTSTGDEQPILLSTTKDGGLTWSSPHTTPATFSNCAIVINPIDVQDIIIHGTDTWGPILDGTIAELGLYYRSLDGGKTWTKLTLPTGDPHINGLVIMQVAWEGTTLFASARFAEQQNIGLPPHQLAKSVNNGPLQWTDQTLPIPSAQVINGNITNMFTIGTTLYVSVTATCEATTPCRLAATRDDGVTWTSFTLPLGITFGLGSPLAVGGDGKTLLDSSNQGYKSIDGGHTWSQLPSLPAGAGITDIRMMVADGTIYAFVSVNVNGISTAVNVYKLLPGASTWSTVSLGDGSIYFIRTISWDTSGHPVALWRIQTTNNNDQPGIGYHAA